MIRPMALAIAMAAPAQAETCYYGSPANGTNITIQPHDEAFAEIVIDNRLAFAYRRVCTVSQFGVGVTVRYLAGPGDEPDWFEIEVPPGFVAEPPSILLEDKTHGSVIIWIDGGAGA